MQTSSTTAVDTALATATVRLQLNMAEPHQRSSTSTKPGRPVQSALGQGRWGLFERMSRSSFGKFRQVLQGLDAVINLQEFTLPCVVVIGDESVGKSSLLENITKCAVFPRAEGICTRCPVRLQLTHAAASADRAVEVQWGVEKWVLRNTDEILARVEQVMSQLSANDISETEVVVKITDSDIPTFEYVDLPGLRGYPPTMAATIKALVKKYLVQPNTLVLCVVPATTPRITSSQALGLVAEHCKQGETILALTMADRVQEGSFAELVVKRLRRDEPSEELNVDGKALMGCVGVKNREHDSVVTLVQTDEQEEKWWIDRLDALPAQTKAAISSQVASYNLVKQMDQLYHQFICRSWKPQALHKLHPLLERAAADVEALGPDIEVLGTEEKAEFTDNLFKDVQRQLVAFWPKVNALPTSEVAAVGPSGSRAWAHNRRHAHDSLRQWVRSYLEQRPFLPEILEAVRGTFNSLAPLRLERFETLRTFTEGLFEAEYDHLIRDKRLEREVEKFITMWAFDYYSQQQLSDALSISKFKSSCQGYVLANVCLPLREANMIFEDRTKARWPRAEESREWRENRQMLVKRHQQLKTAYETISDIEKAVAE